MRDRMPLLLAGAAVLALAATGIGTATQWQRATTAEEEARELAAEVESLRVEVSRLESRLEAAEADGDDGADDADGGPGGGPDDLGDLFDDLLGDTGPFGDLLAGAPPGADCMTPSGGLFEGLLGGGGDDLPDEPQQLVEVVADHVAQLRELEWQRDVEVDFVDGAELSDRLDVLLADDADPEADAARQRLLASLGAVPDDLDLTELQRDLLDEQVAGYYVPETGELVVRVPDDGEIRPLDRVTLAHELEHALADQVLGLPELDEDPYTSDADAALGALALIEGDATLLMNLWALDHLSLTDQLSGLLGGDLAAAQASLDAVPHHLQRELLFPYTAGLDFVCQLYLDGGWSAVDAAYDDPPGTSAEVLFPEDPPSDAVDAPALSTPSGGDELLATTFGAAPLQWLFEAPGGDTDRALDAPRERAAAWAAGSIAVWDMDGATATGLALVDGGGAEEPLCSSVSAWHAAAFPEHVVSGEQDDRLFRGDDSVAVLRCDDDQVRYATAPDIAAAQSIVGTD